MPGKPGICLAAGHGSPPAVPIPWNAAAANALNGVGRIGTWPAVNAACVAISICCRDFSISPLFGGVMLFSFRISSMSTIELSSSSAFESYSISDSADAELCGVLRSFFVVELVVLLESFSWFLWCRSAFRCNDAIASGEILWWARLCSVWCAAADNRCWCFKLIGDAIVVVTLGDNVVDAGDDANDDGRVSASNESTLKLLMRLVLCCCCKMCGTVGLVMAVLTGVTVILDFIMNFFEKSMLICLWIGLEFVSFFVNWNFFSSKILLCFLFQTVLCCSVLCKLRYFRYSFKTQALRLFLWLFLFFCHFCWSTLDWYTYFFIIKTLSSSLDIWNLLFNFEIL